MLLQFLRIDIHLIFLSHHLLGRLEKIEFLLIDIINTLETLSHIDRPGQWAHTDLQLVFKLIQQIERILTLTVHLIDEYDDRRIPHAANLHQFQGLSLYTFGSIHHDDNTVNSSQRSISILSKILVSRRIKDIYLIVMVVELQH